MWWWPRRTRGLVSHYVALSRDGPRVPICQYPPRPVPAVAHRGGLATLLVLALIATGIAVIQLGSAEQQRHIAEQQQRRVTAQYLLGQARATISFNPRTALQFAEAAHHLDPTPEADETLVQLMGDTRYSGTLTGHTDAVHSVAYSPDGHILATGSYDHSVILWDMQDPARPQRIGKPLTGHTDTVESVGSHPTGTPWLPAVPRDSDLVGCAGSCPAATDWTTLDRPNRRRAIGGVRPERAHPSHGQLRQDGDLVGCARPGTTAANWGTHHWLPRRGLFGGVRSGRPNPRYRQRGD